MMENLLKFIREHSTDEVSRLILDRNKYPGIEMELAVNCIESRRKLKGKVHEWHEREDMIFPLKLSAEQCSSSATGRYKSELAERIARREKWTIADLTGGLGVDSWFFSQKAERVIYNEMQSVLCEAAKHNFYVLGSKNIEIVNSTISGDTLNKVLYNDVDVAYIDPARRTEGGRKVFLMEECTPDVLGLKEEIFRYTGNILIKLSPMADISMVCDRLGSTCREVHVVATGGECKELLIWMDREWSGEYTIFAVELHQDSTVSTFSFTPSEEKSSEIILTHCSDTKAYLFEPSKALMKSGAFNLISNRFKIGKLGKSTHYYTTDSPEKANKLKAFGKVFQIIEYQPLDKRSTKDIGKKYPKAEVTARNIPMDTDTLRKKTGIISGDDAHIFGLKSDSEGNLLIAAKRI